MSDPPAGLHAQGRAALAAGDHAAVRRIAARLGGSAEALFLQGIVDAAEGRVSRALPLLAQAVALAPTAEYLAQHARLLIAARRDAEARQAASRAEAAGPADALTADTIGCVLVRLGDHAAAVCLFEQAVASAPDNAEFRYNLAAALGFVGQAAEAAEQFEGVIARVPDHGRAHYALSGLRRHDAGHNHIARLEAVVAADPAPDDALRIRYALAKECEELGEHQAAFHHLDTANGAHRARLAYDFADDAAVFDAIEQAFAEIGPPSDENAAPVFVVGMPRTGTTLVDRILSSHPQVASAGELQAMPLAVKQLAGTPSRRIIDPATVHAAVAADPADIARLYLQRARQHVLPGVERFTDKLPANMLYTGFIARAFPRASIVCLRRHPLDTIWSNYKHLFASTSPYYFYSYDLADTARYYIRFDRLMRFWQRQLPGRVLEMDYERLVADQEGETRQLLAHCGLPWDEACLHFHRNSAAVATPSAAQVRRPMNADAVGRWQVQADALAPARALLQAAGISTE
ncbi:sulfotransferase [Croceibacterium sp. TMG7-5b_MA50]|uniref:tetratricopeptide repeat-containing sulfotransferase family protein n=1 Tax=Croceibacterium sp. TMG7-5b_MA50 TaxID=3121290 RepID=UPI00322215C2